ncbi:uncharacterized protein LOC111039115 [Myzus persicae]|uniref:uncharacterized protein LOC111039115 n=1 Tax=Myzus persicae TaxID=13164 RepID=UPI000B93643A|nr:uncharacterized protein LOC111039115 [Myzus persicae]
MSDLENSMTLERESDFVERRDSEDSCLAKQSRQREVFGTECSNEYFSNNYDGDGDKPCSISDLLGSKYGMNQLFEKHDGTSSDNSVQSFNSNTESSEDLSIIKNIDIDYTSGRSSISSVEREKQSKLIERRDSEDSCLEKQSLQREIVGTESSNEYFTNDINFDQYSDKSCSNSDLLVSKYGINQLLAKHGVSNSNCSFQSYISDTDYTSRRSSINSVEQMEMMRPEDDSVKAIESIDDNCEIRWPVKRKIDKKLYKRRLNARIHRLISPKSALAVFSELFRDVPIQIEDRPFLNGRIYTATIEIDGQTYVANNISKSEAKQKACENLFRNMLAKKLNMQSENKESSVDIEMENGENGTAQKPMGPPQEEFPWPHFASLAMYQLINHWKIQPAPKGINLQDERSKVAAPMKLFPEDPSKYNPVQLLNHMKPGTEFIVTRCLDFPSCFQVSCVIDGVPFTGQHSSKKGAKNEACIAAIKYFWTFNFHNI